MRLRLVWERGSNIDWSFKDILAQKQTTFDSCSKPPATLSKVLFIQLYLEKDKIIKLSCRNVFCHAV